MLRVSRFGFVTLVSMAILLAPRLWAAEDELKKSLLGDWTVESRTIGGKKLEEYSGSVFSPDATDKAGLTFANGRAQKFKFNAKVHDEKSKTFRFTIQTPEDEAGAGGGGPRKGICKINDKGELEILETTSASDDFPADFSDLAAKNCLQWKLKRNTDIKK